MPVDADMIDHLGSNVTFLAALWKITAPDLTVAAFAAHTRDISFGGTLYKATPSEPTRSTRKEGVQPDGAELTGVFDDTITEANIIGGKWRGSRIYKAFVNYLDLTMGAVAEANGFAGKFSIRKGTFVCEFLSLSTKLSQEIGDLTSPIDRRRRLSETGISLAPFQHAATVTGVTDRRRFTTGVVQANSYFKYGLVTWLTGANAGLSMEIKDNVAGAIELQLPMRSAIVIGDTATLLRGYDSTRDAAKAIHADVMTSFDAEPDLPGISKVLTYPD